MLVGMSEYLDACACLSMCSQQSYTTGEEYLDSGSTKAAIFGT